MHACPHLLLALELRAPGALHVHRPRLARRPELRVRFGDASDDSALAAEREAVDADVSAGRHLQDVKASAIRPLRVLHRLRERLDRRAADAEDDPPGGPPLVEFAGLLIVLLFVSTVGWCVCGCSMSMTCCHYPVVTVIVTFNYMALTCFGAYDSSVRYCVFLSAPPYSWLSAMTPCIAITAFCMFGPPWPRFTFSMK